MGKPLLTDELLKQVGYDMGEEAYVEEEWESQDTTEVYFDQRDFDNLDPVSEEESLTSRIEVIPSIIKSRRIENERRSLFQSKLNQILLVVIFLGIILVLAIIYL